MFVILGDTFLRIDIASPTLLSLEANSTKLVILCVLLASSTIFLASLTWFMVLEDTLDTFAKSSNLLPTFINSLAVFAPFNPLPTIPNPIKLSPTIPRFIAAFLAISPADLSLCISLTKSTIVSNPAAAAPTPPGIIDAAPNAKDAQSPTFDSATVPSVLLYSGLV